MNGLFTRKECAQLLRISARTLDRRIKEGQISVITVGRGCRVLIAEKAVEEYLKRYSKRVTYRKTAV